MRYDHRKILMYPFERPLGLSDRLVYLLILSYLLKNRLNTVLIGRFVIRFILLTTSYTLFDGPIDPSNILILQPKLSF